MKKYGFGIDIGGTTCKIGLLETAGNIVEKWEIPTRTQNGGEQILPDVASFILEKIEERKIPKDEIQGIGIGVPGPVTPEGVVLKCINLGWGVRNIAKEMEERTGFAVKAGNDANVAALGEMWKGGGKGKKNLIMVTLGTGVGGGVVIDGNMIAGSSGAGGEFGHMKVNPHETESCGCGKCGCLEQYASATGIVRLAKRTLANMTEETSLRGVKALTAKAVFDAAKAGDKAADGIVEKMAEILGMALANIACVVNPEIIVIGGGVSKAGSILTERVETHFRKNVFHACLNAEIVLASLGNDAGMYGCVRMLLS